MSTVFRTGFGPRSATVVLVAAAALGGAAGCVSTGAAPPPVSSPGVVSGASSPEAAAPGPRVPDGGSRPAEPPTAGLPPGVRLPDEGERSTSPDVTDWITDETIDQPWLLDPCRPTAYPTDARRTGFRTVSRTGPEARDARQLAVYPSAEIAVEAVAGFRRALAACSTGGPATQGGRWEWVTADAPDLGDEGLVAASTTGGPGFSPAGDRIAVTRAGSAVFLAYLSGEFATADLDGGTRSAREVAQTFLDSL